MFDRTEQRIIGVLIEKELAVPDSYPMTENALVAGCNQKSNRDPEMALEVFEVAGALNALREKEWVVKVEGSRADRYRHELTQRLDVDRNQKAVLCELLVRGPQAPGALKPRVARMGFQASPAEITAVLEGLRSRSGGPLVEQLPRIPRERDQRWGHCMGPRDASHEASHEAEGEEDTLVLRPSGAAPGASSVPASPPPPPPSPSAPVTPSPPVATPPPVAQARPGPDFADLETRVAQLESELAALAEEVQRLRGDPD